MRIPLLSLIGCCVLASACGGAAALEDDVVAGCQACHRDALSLASREPAALRERIAALAAGSGTHPVPLPALSDSDIAALAQRLTAQ